MSVQLHERVEQTQPVAVKGIAANGYEPIPLLESGDLLTRVEFERRYQLHPEIKKAELIEGEVYVASPVHVKKHGDPHFDLVTWTGVYRAATPGVVGSDNAIVRLDLENEPQPDILLRLAPEVGGRAYVADDDYLEGAPELIVEVAASSASYDMNKKKRMYARNGVREYVVAQAYEQRVDWFVLRADGYEILRPDENGVVRSEVFPGLWLPSDAVWQGNLSKMLAVLQEGLTSAEHAEFVKCLEQKRM
jgi:Uma2 family endonuclease